MWSPKESVARKEVTNFDGLLKQKIQSCFKMSSLLLTTEAVVMTHRQRSKTSELKRDETVMS